MPRPLLIFLPGTDGTGAFFDMFAKALAPACDIRILSYPQQGDQSYERLAEHIAPELPANRDYVLLGESFGGPLAIHLAAHAKRRPEALILGASFAASPFGTLGRLVSPVVPLARFIPLRCWQIRFMLFNGGHEDWATRIFENTRSIDRRVLLRRVQSVLTCDMRETLTRLSLPVLCLNAGHDRLLTSFLPRHIPNADHIRAVSLPLPHMIFQAAPDDIAVNHVLPFIQSVGATDTPLSRTDAL